MKVLKTIRKFTNRAILLIVIWTLMLLLSLALLSVLTSFLAANPQSFSISSLSWSGYTVNGVSTNSQIGAVYVNASWVVPQLNVSAGDGYSSVWIGIGGQLDKTLIQIGTEHDVARGEESYFAWYELLPNFEVRLPRINVSPGDTMVASIDLINSKINHWRIQISNPRTGQDFIRDVVYNSTRSSGEWVLERPTVKNQTSVLADFGRVTFTDCYVQVNGVRGPITSFPCSQIQMANSQYVKLTKVSALSSGGSSFTVSYIASK
jgi:hypothetical protein